MQILIYFFMDAEIRLRDRRHDAHYFENPAALLGSFNPFTGKKTLTCLFQSPSVSMDDETAPKLSWNTENSLTAVATGLGWPWSALLGGWGKMVCLPKREKAAGLKWFLKWQLRVTLETSTFPQPYVVVEGKCAHWSQTMLDMDFQTLCWYLVPWNWGRVYRAHQTMIMVPLFKSFTLTEPSKEGKRNHTSGQDNPSERGLVNFFLLFLAARDIKISLLCLHILRSTWVVRICCGTRGVWCCSGLASVSGGRRPEAKMW